MAKSYNKTQESVSPFTLFHKVLHNFGDWELETAYMSRIERSIYFDMRTLYLKSGQPLTSDLELLARRIRCNDEAELKALEFILKDKFIYDKKRSVYRHREWDLMIKNYKFSHRNDNSNNEASNDMVTNSNEASNDRALSNAERQARFKERKRMLKELENKGVIVDGGMSFSDVVVIYNGYFDHAINEAVTKDNDGNENGNDGNEKNNAKNEAITNNHKPITNNHKPNIKTSITQSADADAVVCAGVELNEHQAEAEEIPSETQQKPKKAKPSKADAWKALLAENGIVGQLADDYIAIRLAKNAPLTATAMEGLKREAAKAGMTLEQAITYSTEQGWQGFKAEWLLNKVFGSGGGNQSKPQNRINDLPKHTQGGAFLAKDIF